MVGLQNCLIKGSLKNEIYITKVKKATHIKRTTDNVLDSNLFYIL